MADPTKINIFNVTNEDIINASTYASYFADKLRHQLYSEKIPHVFGHAVPREEILTVQPANIPKNLVIMKFTLHMPNKKTCDQISCFKILPNEYTCQKDTPTRRVFLGDKTSIITCQPACFLYENNASYHLNWINNKCVLDPNYFINIYAMDPKRRSEKKIKGITNLERGFDVDPKTNIMYINKSYCDHFERDYDSKKQKCFKSPLDWFISEIFTGDTIVTFIKKIKNNKDFIATNNVMTSILEDFSEPVPDHIKNYKNWMNFQPEKKYFAPENDLVGSWKDSFDEFKNNFKQLDWKVFLQGFFSWENVQSMLLNMGFDQSIALVKKMSIKLIGKFFNSAIFKGLLKATMNVPLFLFRNVLKQALVKHLIKFAIGTSIKVASKAASLIGIVIDFVLIVVSIVGLILDIWDPYGLNNITDKEALYDISLQLKASYVEEMRKLGAESLVGNEFDVRLLYSLYKKDVEDAYPDIEERVETVFHDKLYEYLYKLKISSSGQDLSPWRNQERISINVNEKIQNLNLSSIISGWDEDFDEEYLQLNNNTITFAVSAILMSIIILSFYKKQYNIFLICFFLLIAFNFYYRSTIDKSMINFVDVLI